MTDKFPKWTLATVLMLGDFKTSMGASSYENIECLEILVIFYLGCHVHFSSIVC